MDKRFQFFISSTFADLRDERQAVLKAVLELNQMPAGMELFPASDDTAWQLIRDVIDASDYYLLVIGGRYGSVDEAGLGYTEKEYDYAIQTRKPVIAFLHADPGMLPRDKTETDDAAWKKLEAFRAKVEKKHTRVSWTSAEDLKSKVIVGVTSALKRHPAVGWLRADQVPSGGTLADVLTLRNRVAELETQLREVALVAPAGTEELEHGDDPVRIDVQFKTRNPSNYVSETFKDHITLTWNDIFAGVAPTMISEASDQDLRSAFHALFKRHSREAFGNSKHAHRRELGNSTFRDDQVETCIVQFRALGLIRESVRQRSVKDTNTYWKLTPWGDHRMTMLRAIRRVRNRPEGQSAADAAALPDLEQT